MRDGDALRYASVIRPVEPAYRRGSVRPPRLSPRQVDTRLIRALYS